MYTTHTAPPPLISDDPDPITIVRVTSGNTLAISWPMPNILFIREYVITYTFMPYMFSRGRRQTSTGSDPVTVTSLTNSLDIPDFSGGGTYTADIDVVIEAPAADPITLNVLPDNTVFTAPDRGNYCGSVFCYCPALFRHVLLQTVCIVCIV